LRDRQVGTLELFAIAPGGSSSTIGNNHMPSVSDDDDRYLAFLGVVPGSIGGPHASLRDRNSGVTIQVSASQSGSLDEDSYEVALSADGSTLSVGAYVEASSATGVGGDQADNSASDAGAVYVY